MSYIAPLLNPAAAKRMFRVVAIFAAVGLGYGLISAKWYRSVLTVVPAAQQRPSVSSLIGSELGALAAGAASSIGGGGADANRVAAVLQSIAVTDAVIEKFDLKKRYKQQYQEYAREALWRHCDVKILPKPNLVRLSCEDTDPRFAQEMLSYFAEYGNQVFRRVSVSSASEEVRFLDRHVRELRQQANDAGNRMLEFQEQHKIVDLESQAKAIVSALAGLNSQRISKQLELDYAKTFSSHDESTIRQLRSQLSVVNDRVRDLEQLGAGKPQLVSPDASQVPDRGIFPAALSVPRLRAEFEALYRDRKVAEATLVFALERLESARAAEAREVSTFLVLDPPPLPTRKSRPQRLIILLGCAVFGLVVGAVIELWRVGLLSTSGAVRSESADEDAQPRAVER